MWWIIWLGSCGGMSSSSITKMEYTRVMATGTGKHRILPHWRNCWNAIRHRHNTNEDGFVNESASSCSGGCKSKRLDIYSSCHTNCSWRWCKRAYFAQWWRWRSIEKKPRKRKRQQIYDLGFRLLYICHPQGQQLVESPKDVLLDSARWPRRPAGAPQDWGGRRPIGGKHLIFSAVSFKNAKKTYI